MQQLGMLRITPVPDLLYHLVEIARQQRTFLPRAVGSESTAHAMGIIGIASLVHDAANLVEREVEAWR